MYLNRVEEYEVLIFNKILKLLIFYHTYNMYIHFKIYSKV